MNKKEMNKLIQEAIKLHKEKHDIIEGNTALETIELNTPTADELTKYWHIFQFDGVLQYQIVKIFSLLKYLAKEIDKLQ